MSPGLNTSSKYMSPGPNTASTIKILDKQKLSNYEGFDAKETD